MREPPAAGRRHPLTGRLLDWPADRNRSHQLEAFSDDGKMVARENYPGRSVALIDQDTSRPFAVVGSDQGYERVLAFSPDGRWLATGGNDTTILLWDIEWLRVKYLSDELLAGREDARQTSRVAAITAEIGRRLHRLVAAEARALPHIRDLDDDEFEVRQKATRALERMGEEARPALLLAQENSPSLEVRKRAERLLSHLGNGESGSVPFPLKQALIRFAKLGTPARRLLEELARGERGSTIALAARQALEAERGKGGAP